MKGPLLLFLLGGIIVITGACLVVYTYKLVLMDAESRKLKKPKFWAFLASAAQNGSGLPLYLFKRRGSVPFLTSEDQKKMNWIKRKIYALLIFDVVVFILAVIVLLNT